MNVEATANKLRQLLPDMLATAGEDQLEAICMALNIEPVDDEAD